jgi:hypothetical protein
MREYEIAESLYQGDFPEEDLGEDWLIPRREGLKDSYLVILDRLRAPPGPAPVSPLR